LMMTNFWLPLVIVGISMDKLRSMSFTTITQGSNNKYMKMSLNARNILEQKNKFHSYKILTKLRCSSENADKETISSDESSNVTLVDKEEDKAAAKIKSENVNLFAVDDRKAIKIPPSSDILSTIKDSKVSSSIIRSTDKQAEILRLEAEKEQLQIDALRIQNEKNRLIAVDKALLRILSAEDKSIDVFRKLIVEEKSLVRKEMFFRLAELINISPKAEEKQRLMDLYSVMLDCLKETDATLFEEVKSDISKELLGESNRIKPLTLKDPTNVYDQVLQQWVQQANLSTPLIISTNGSTPLDLLNLLGVNGTSGMGAPTVIRFPSAVPMNMMPMLMRSPELSKQDITLLREAVFTPDILNNSIVDSSSVIITFRGDPCGSIQETYSKALRRIALVPGLADRVRLFVLPEYRLPDAKRTVLEKYSGNKFEPVFTVFPKNAGPSKRDSVELAVAISAVVTSVVACFIYSVDLNSYNPKFFAQAMAGDEAVVASIVPIVGGILLLQAVHDAGHYLMGRLRGLELLFPSVLLPSLQIGLFGSVTRLLAFPKDRKQLFDVAIAGPLCGFIASLLCLFSGLSLTAEATPEMLATFPQVPTGFFQISLLLHEIVDQYLHISSVPISSYATALTPVHPLLAVGIVGMLSNAFNFMPIGKLDGGRVAMSIAGRQSANTISFFTLLSQALTLLTSSSAVSPVSLFWIITVVFLQRGADLPPEDDVTPVATDEDDAKKSPAWILRMLSFAFCVVLTAERSGRSC